MLRMIISRVVLFSSANRSGEEIYTVRRARESLLDGFAQDAQLTRGAEKCDVFFTVGLFDCARSGQFERRDWHTGSLLMFLRRRRGTHIDKRLNI